MTNANAQLRQLRLRRNWTQSVLADKVGTTVVNISRWERGTISPSLHFRQKLCEVFECTIEELGLLNTQEDLRSSQSKEADVPPSLPDPSPSLSLPFQQSRYFVGREPFLSPFVEKLCAGKRDFALVGLPGVGKTAFVQTIAVDPRIQEHFSDGILWVGLGQEPQIQEELNRWAHDLHLPPAKMGTLATLQDWARALHHHIGARRMLLIIDDAWTLADATLFQLGGPNCAHVLTTRFPALALPFAHEEVIHLEELSEESGIQLLMQLVPQIATIAPEEIRRLVQAVGGLPLALTLLGRHLYVQAQSGPMRRLHTAMQRLLVGMKERLQIAEPYPVWKSPATGTSLSLQTAISISVQFLSPRAKKALHALAVFPPKPHTFSEEAALAVCQSTPEETLDQLVDFGLLESDTTGRYRIHQTIADFARLQHPSKDAERHLIEFVVGYVHSHHQHDGLLEQELATITTAIDIARSHKQFQNLHEIILTLVPFLKRRLLFGLAHTMLLHAQQAAIQLHDDEKLAWIWFHLGSIAHLQSKLQQAEEAYQECLNLARNIDQQILLSHTLIQLGDVIIAQGEHLRAESIFLEGGQLASALHLPQLESIALRNLGEIEDWKGNSQRANIYYQQGLDVARAIHDDESMGALLQNLGVKAARRGDYQGAMRYYEEGLRIAQHSHDLQRESALLMNTGMLAFQQQQVDLAIKQTHKALEIARLCGNTIRSSSSLQNLGIFESYRGNIQQAELYFQESLEMAQEMNHSWLLCEATVELGMHYIRHKQWEQATTTLQKAHIEARTLDATLLLAQVLFGLAQIEAYQQHPQQAHCYARESQELYEQAEHENAHVVSEWLTNVTEDSCL